MTGGRVTAAGPVWALAAVTCFSINDTAIKYLSDAYALHQIVLIRSVVALVILLGLVVPLAGGRVLLRTRKLRLHLLRGVCIVFANMTFFLGLSALPLAEAVAIFFVAPLLIAVLSVLFLGETVGPWRWGAIAVGLCGVVVVVRPGTDAFQPAALLPVVAAGCYAMVHILTRRMGGTESPVTMTVFMQAVFIVVSLVFGLALGHGRFDVYDDPSLSFLFRGWTWPEVADLWLFGLIGAGITGAGLMISQAYRVSEAALVAPFEYIALPLSIVFGYLVFGEVPDLTALLGTALILVSGLALIWREARVRKAVVAPRARR